MRAPLASECNDRYIARMTSLPTSGWLARQPAALGAALLNAGRQVALASGQWVYGEGDDATGIVVVLDGTLRLEAMVDADRTVLVGLAPRGAAFGQSRRRGGGPRIVTARAAGPARVLLLGDGALDRVGADFPDVWRAVSEAVYAQLDASVHILAQVLALPPRARLAARLAMLAHDGAVRVTQADLAELTGVSRKTANAHLAALEAAGAIARRYGAVEVRDARLLARAAGLG